MQKNHIRHCALIVRIGKSLGEIERINKNYGYDEKTLIHAATCGMWRIGDELIPQIDIVIAEDSGGKFCAVFKPVTWIKVSERFALGHAGKDKKRADFDREVFDMKAQKLVENGKIEGRWQFIGEDVSSCENYSAYIGERLPESEKSSFPASCYSFTWSFSSVKHWGRTPVQARSSASDEKLNKDAAISMVNEKLGKILNPTNTTFSNVVSPGVWWINPPNGKFDDDHYLLLNHHDAKKIHCFFIPARAIANPEQIFSQRKDRGSVSDIEIPPHDAEFRDRKGTQNFSFRKYLTDEIDY